MKSSRMILLALVVFATAGAQTDYVRIVSEGGSPIRCYVDGVEQPGTHSQEHTRDQRLTNLVLSYPDADVRCAQTETIVGWLTAAGRALVESADAAIVVIAPEAASFTVDLDGSATAHQIAIKVDGTGIAQGTDATMRWRETGGSWVTGHDLFRVQSGSWSPSPWGALADEFAWTIIDLDPDTEYEVEVTIDGASASLTTTTKALPPAAGVVTDTITNPSTQLASAINGASAGDVIQISNGTYSVGELSITSSGGTPENPVYVRGESRDGVILDMTSSGAGNALFQFGGASDSIVFENFTIEGPGGTSSTAEAFGNFDTGGSARDITIRDITVTGVRRGVYMYYFADRWLVYNNTFEGRNPWTSARYETNAAWDDYGIHLPGNSNEVFSNTLTGFGDVISFANSNEGDEPYNNHAHHNDIINAMDDLVEWDDGTRNLTFYDNRGTNVQNISSLQPLYGGPLIIARNTAINMARRNPLKWNENSAGVFYYNNTVVGTGSGTVIDAPGGPFGPGLSANIYIPSGPEIEYIGFDNNLFISGASISRILAIDVTGLSNMDWRNNYWYPDGPIEFDPYPTYSDVADANATSSTSFTPVFGSQTRLVQTDGVSEATPFVTDVELGADESTEVTVNYYPILDGASAAKNAGVAIPGITDGYTGAAPDVGAVIAGRSQPVYGDPGNTRLKQIADAIAPGGSNLNISELENDLVGYTGTGNGESKQYDISWVANVSFYDPIRKELHYMGKPQSTFSNASYNYSHYIYSEANESWRTTGRTLTTGDTRGHMYSSAAFDATSGDYYFHTWADNRIRRYDRDADSWSNSPTNANLPGGEDWMAGAVFHPNAFGPGDGGYIATPTGSTTARVWRISNNTWNDLAGVQVLQQGNPWTSGGMGIYVPGLDIAVVGGEGGDVYQIAAGSGGSLGSVTNVGVSSVDFGWERDMPSNWHKLVVDPNDSSRLLALELGTPYEVWASDDGADTWTSVGNHPFSTTDGYGTAASFNSIETYGVILCMTSETLGSTPFNAISLWKPNF